MAEGWLEPDNAFRKLALELGPAETGFSRATLAKGSGQFLPATHAATIFMRCWNRNSAMTQDGLTSLPPRTVEQKSNSCGDWSSARNFSSTSRRATFRIPTLTSIVLGLLTRSAQFVKCASGSAFLPRLFAHSIYDADPKLGACLEIAEWRGGNADLETALFAEADCVTATGSDETLGGDPRAVAGQNPFSRLRPSRQFWFCGGRSFASVRLRGKSSRERRTTWWPGTSSAVFRRTSFMSKSGGEVSPEKFAELLADELERREQTEPRGELAAEHAAAIASRRGIYEVRAAHSPETRRCGAARIPRPGRWFLRRTRGFNCRA